MQAYKNSQDLKQRAIDRAKTKIKSGTLEQGCWKNGLIGSFVTSGDYSCFFVTWGIDPRLAGVIESIFDNLDKNEFQDFYKSIFEGLPVGSDTTKIYHLFAAELMTAVYNISETPHAHQVMLLHSQSASSSDARVSVEWEDARARATSAIELIKKDQPLSDFKIKRNSLYSVLRSTESSIAAQVGYEEQAKKRLKLERSYKAAKSKLEDKQQLRDFNSQPHDLESQEELNVLAAEISVLSDLYNEAQLALIDHTVDFDYQLNQWAVCACSSVEHAVSVGLEPKQLKDKLLNILKDQ